MQIYHALTPVDAPQGSAVALGYFDGVHCGHRQVVGSAVRCAAQRGLAPAAFTFELPGNQTLKGGRILSPRQKHLRIAGLGVTQYLEPPFEAFRNLSPEEFVQKVLVDCFHAKAVFCGDNFTFGARAAGNVELLHTLCGRAGIEVNIVPMAQYGAQAVSSTRIRAALEEGRLDDANAMLGAPYAIDWQVTHGKGIGGSRLGTPTVNQNYPPVGGPPLPASAAAPRWMTAPRPPSPARPTCRISTAICTASARCWNSTAISARSANTPRWRTWRRLSGAPRRTARPTLRPRR